jgi:hypothetical protein
MHLQLLLIDHYSIYGIYNQDKKERLETLNEKEK